MMPNRIEVASRPGAARENYPKGWNEHPFVWFNLQTWLLTGGPEGFHYALAASSAQALHPGACFAAIFSRWGTGWIIPRKRADDACGLVHCRTDPLQNCIVL
jgi:hypothetical protein